MPPAEPAYDWGLASDWEAVRPPSTIRRRVIETAPEAQTPVENAVPWLYSTGQAGVTTLVVPGAHPAARMGFYGALEARALPGVVFDRTGPREWLQGSPLDDWTARIGRLRIPSECQDMLPDGFGRYPEWELLWALAYLEEFVIEEPLRSMVDRRNYLVHDATRMLLEFRFLIQEGVPYESALATLRTFVKWISMGNLDAHDIKCLTHAGVRRRVTSINERIDLLVFLLTVAEQNALILKSVFVFDGLEAACNDRPRLRELHTMMQGIARWSKAMETPIGFVLGLDLKRRPQLRRANEKLSDDVTRGLEWTR